MGLATFLLVFTGIWMVTERFMDRTNGGGRRFALFGVGLLLLGVLSAIGLAGVLLGIAAMVLAAITAVLLVVWRGKGGLRGWVRWVWVVLCLGIAISLLTDLI